MRPLAEITWICRVFWACAFLAVTLIVFGGNALVTEQVAAQAAEKESGGDEESSEAAEEEDSGDKPDEESAGQDDQDDTPSEGTVEEEEPSEEEIAPDDVENEEKVEKPDDPKEGDKIEVPPENKKRIIGATTTVQERQSGLLFRARVDTGAKSTSLHCDKMRIDDESEVWAENVGKIVHFQVTNGKDEPHWLEAKIETYVIVKTSDHRERRYKVLLDLQWNNVKKRVLVTLNNRGEMDFPLLLGRNFLKGDFLVDVEIDNDD